MRFNTFIRFTATCKRNRNYYKDKTLWLLLWNQELKSILPEIVSIKNLTNIYKNNTTYIRQRIKTNYTRITSLLNSIKLSLQLANRYKTNNIFSNLLTIHGMDRITYQYREIFRISTRDKTSYILRHFVKDNEPISYEFSDLLNTLSQLFFDDGKCIIRRYYKSKYITEIKFASEVIVKL